MAHTIDISDWYKHPVAPKFRGAYPHSLEPALDNRYANAPFSVWDKTQSSPTVYAASSDSDINTHAATAAGTPAADHLIEVSASALTNTSGDIRFINLSDFESAGGSLKIKYTGVGYCSYDGPVLSTGTSGGIIFEGFQFDREVDGYIDQGLNRSTQATIRTHSGGAFVFDGCRFGAYWGSNSEQYQNHPTAFYNLGGGDLLIRNCELRSVGSGLEMNDGGDVHIIGSFIDGNWIDKLYFQNTSATTTRVWIHDYEGGYPYGGTDTLMLTNEPFQVGETVHQDNTGAGGDLIIGTISRIVEPTDSGADPQSFISAWTGNLVWIEMDAVNGGALVDNVAVVGQTSGASFTPTQTDTSGNSGDWDAGYPAIGFHNDILQFGSSTDDAGASYEFYIDGIYSVTGDAVQDVDQGFFTDNQSPADVKVVINQAQLGISAVNGCVVTTKDVQIDYLSMFHSPYGKRIPDKFSYPDLGWNNKPVLRFQSNPKSPGATPSIGNVISGDDVYYDDQADWSGLDVSSVVVADGSDQSGVNSWQNRFENFGGSWQTDQWVESKPTRANMSKGGVKAWIRDNRRPVGGWSDGGWVNPTRYNV